MHGRQEARTPARCAPFGRAFGLSHHDVSGQVRTLGTESVGHPGAEAGITHEDAPGRHLIHRGGMHDAVGNA